MSHHVIVAGGGPAGLLTALGLAQAGIAVTVLEAAQAANTSPRAMVYHWPVLPHLERLGILDDCRRIGFLKQDYGWRFAHTGEMIDWSLECLADEVERPFNLHLGQDKLSDIVFGHLAKMSNVTVRMGRKVVDLVQDAGSVTVTVETVDGERETYEGDYLIGSDGAASVVREKLLKLNFFGVTWPERFIATNIYCDFERHGYRRTTMQVDDEQGAIIVKIDDGRFWRVTFMEDAALPSESIEARIHEKFKTLLPPGESYELVAFSPYRMHQRAADTMQVGRVLLVGDAGHITNPTGGLGLTSGMFDSFAVVETLKRVMLDGAAPGLLKDYSDDRRRKFIELVSPRASQNKLTVFHSAPGKAFDIWTERMREIARNKDLQRGALSFTAGLATQFS
ncbi:FAD-dependent oxidoreductase [Falsigemmobacter faecalis]|uniref:FAD-dependent monooxygenase n=1 Tax=Falsigemmobacter faecalis TaxID=2488730 RepID=A0A3P3D5D3_9RHOB|nr:NAD(P)/FAD-dependent oxidoreductase [Falsigemmobacter faecalis]RRH69351.1 FAD-dependent monooxygenase [Falsigemmobacter faecalis]